VNLTSLPFGYIISSISTSEQASHMLLASGTVYSFGSNAFGALAVGSAAPAVSSTPLAMKMDGALSGKQIMFIATGGFSMMLITTDGVAYSFGYN
jgi:alpha-tubulin suppressor-like RCC1 family protein